ncbi:MAG TPA: serine/threonine-protein kinase, partial [Kofleriaceae bacterium]
MGAAEDTRDSRCPSDAQVAAFVERTLPAPDRDAVESHVFACETCREALAHVVATTGAPRQLGRYRLDRVIGSGGMGVVWQAWDPALERRLAIKLLRPELTGDDGGARLVREARALAKLQHPNVVAVHDVGEVDGEVFIATELIDGEPMARWQHGRPARELLAAYAQAARGLWAANQLGLVHRDVKPNNIFVGHDGRVRIGDFGLATRRGAQVAPALGSEPAGVTGTETTLSSTGRVVGTPAYMPPEQRAGEAVDERADQYSLCVAIAEALTGERPAAGATAAALAASGVDAPWDVIARGLAAAPGDRHADLAPLVAALDGTPPRARRWWIGVALAAAAVIVLLVARGAAPASRCAGRQPLAGSWSPAVQRQLAGQFHASRLAYANDAAATATTALDGFAAAFTAEDRQACEAPAPRRAACLDRVRGQLDALLATMQSTPDAATIQRAAASVRALPDPALCNTPGALADQTIPADVTLAVRMRWLSAEVAQAAALRRLGKLPA